MKDYHYNFWNIHKQEIIDLVNKGCSKNHILDLLAFKYEYYCDVSQLNKYLKLWKGEY